VVFPSLFVCVTRGITLCDTAKFPLQQHPPLWAALCGVVCVNSAGSVWLLFLRTHSMGSLLNLFETVQDGSQLFKLDCCAVFTLLKGLN
jgi:hypothetical protein